MVGPLSGKVKGKTNAYAFFVQLCRDEHKKQFPGELLEYQMFSKKCAERWKTMTEREKRWFNQLEEQDKKRFEEEQALKRQNANARKDSALKQKVVKSKPHSQLFQKALKMGKVYKDMLGAREG